MLPTHSLVDPIRTTNYPLTVDLSPHQVTGLLKNLAPPKYTHTCSHTHTQT